MRSSTTSRASTRDAQAALAQLIKQYGDAASYQQTEVYAARGDVPKALTMLERARTVGDPGLQSAKVDPLFDSLRNDPRYKALIAQLKFPLTSRAAKRLDRAASDCFRRLCIRPCRVHTG